MGIWTAVKKLESEDRARNVEFRVSPDGELFRYYVNVWTVVYGDDLFFHPDGGYWSCPEMSGYYSNLSECEKAARSDVPWLQQSN